MNQLHRFTCCRMLSLAVFFHPHEEKSFLSWMRQTNQLFTGDEYQTRFGIWLSNKRFVQEHNKAQRGFTVEMNHLSALTQSEYKSLLGYRQEVDYIKVDRSIITKDAPESIDWRTKGAVNTPKDQGSCGSCWAFSSISSVETGWFLKTGTLLSFSEQNLVDCVCICGGCDGGVMYAAYDHIIKVQGGHFQLEKDYPYKGIDDSCIYDSRVAIGKLAGYVKLTKGDEKELEAKVATGAVSIAIDASLSSFNLYHSGIYDEPKCSTEKLDHAVVAIGYGAENGAKYWIVRNSWGASWGENGYIRIAKDKGNRCGVATAAIMPTF